MGGEVQVSAGGVYDLRYHVVWVPKDRRPALTGQVKDRCEALIHVRYGDRDWQLRALRVMPDHVHLFVKAHPKCSRSFITNQLTGFTRRALRAEFPHLRSRLPALWSRSYFAATVGAVSAGMGQRYIATRYERPWRKEQPA